MTVSSIRDEFFRSGRLTRTARDELRRCLQSSDPYPAISLVGDAGESRLIRDVAECLDSPDPMVRWNAAGVIFTRMKDASYAEVCLRIVKTDEDLLVRAVAACGLGELLPKIRDVQLKEACALTLLRLVQDPKEQAGLREAAYEGILAAVEIPPPDRPPASRHLDLDRDVENQIVEQFKEEYL